MPKIRHVLFLCAGNTCRSPFAEYYAKWLKNNEYKEEINEIYFDSAGIYHYYEKPQEGTLKYLESKGIDASDFIGKKVTRELLDKQDLILAFEQKHHVNKLLRKFKDIKDLKEKVYLLLDFAGETENLEILDPFYYEEEKYRETMKRIEKGIIKALDKIIKMNKSSEST